MEAIKLKTRAFHPKHHYPTQNIHENIVVAQEMGHIMHKMRRRTGFVVIKVDLAKAYDRLRWSFIAAVLEEVGVPKELRMIIMSCVTSVNTNVMWRGCISELFAPSRAVNDGVWCPLRAGRTGLAVSHLMFVEDLLLFGKSTTDNMKAITDTLYKFCSLAGKYLGIPLIGKSTSSRIGGGLSLRNLSKTDNVCLIKMGWEPKQHNDNLWCKVLRGKYGRGQLEEGNAIAKVSDSFIWKDQLVLATDMGSNPESINNWSLTDLVDEAGQWKMDSFSELVGHDIVQKIMAIPRR
ncbi:ribonuclease H [Trifolium pratense]|uniref:Ribonuclease H n=1 Tax=Trifolium pratense TaxID=57577 RepID=A0A2K3NRK3_TRIPR|nr:ribonuclease H [Trifolium pratense]